MLLTADRVLIDGQPRSDVGVRVGEGGRITAVAPLAELGVPDEVLHGRFLLPGTVNSHCQVVMRLGRGHNTAPAAPQLDAASTEVVSRQAFIEMALAGVTAVGVTDGQSVPVDAPRGSDDEGRVEALVRAASAVGIRMVLLRAVSPSLAAQGADGAAESIRRVAERIVERRDCRVGWGVAVDDQDAGPADAIVALKTRFAHVPFHIRISQDAAAVERCVALYGVPPVERLIDAGAIDGLTTLVGPVHLRPDEGPPVARSGATVCVRPSTDEEAGRGLLSASELHRLQVPLSLGGDARTRVSILEDARRLEVHARLVDGRRDPSNPPLGDTAVHTVLAAATVGGARALGLRAGCITEGTWADLVSVDLGDPALCGWTDQALLAMLLRSGDSRLIRDVMVAGHWIVKDGWHPRAQESADAFAELAGRDGGPLAVIDR